MKQISYSGNCILKLRNTFSLFKTQSRIKNKPTLSFQQFIQQSRLFQSPKNLHRPEKKHKSAFLLYQENKKNSNNGCQIFTQENCIKRAKLRDRHGIKTTLNCGQNNSKHFIPRIPTLKNKKDQYYSVNHNPPEQSFITPERGYIEGPMIILSKILNNQEMKRTQKSEQRFNRKRNFYKKSMMTPMKSKQAAGSKQIYRPWSPHYQELQAPKSWKLSKNSTKF